MKVYLQRAAVAVLAFWMVTVFYLAYSGFYNNDEPHFNKRDLQLKIRQPFMFGMNNTNGMKHELYGLPPDMMIHVCLTSDENTVVGMIATINSIHKNTKQAVMFHLVLPDDLISHVRFWIENSDLRKIRYEIKPFNIAWVEGKILVRGGRKELAKPMNYARFYYSELFPDLNGKVIHIDDDCIVQGDITQLYNTELGSSNIAAFSEDCSSVSKRLTLFQNIYANFLNFHNKKIHALHLKPTACSFNTGVYVFDIDRWRAANITHQLEYWMELNTKENIYGNEKGGGGSQPPMMIVLYKRYSFIDPMWHVRHLGWTAGAQYSKQFIEQAKLLHWNGRFKPWGGVAQFSNIWDSYYVPDPLNKYEPVRKAKRKG